MCYNPFRAAIRRGQKTTRLGGQRITRYLFSLLACLAFTLPFRPVAASEQTIYLVRHAEKISDGSNNPPLSPRGRQRAEWYAGYFADKNLSTLYSTDFRRTLETAGPVARVTGLKVRTYDPGDLAALARELRQLDGAILVVGHSNTTPLLAGLLSGQALPPLDEQHYDRIFIITIDNEGATRLHMDHSDPRRE